MEQARSAPPAHAGAIPTCLPRAFSRAMEGAGDKRLIFLSAPEGYGKTTFAAQWLAARGIPAHWLTFDACDDAPSVLCGDLIALLRRVQPDNAALADAARGDAADPAARLLACVMALREQEPPAAIVLDDLHALGPKGRELLPGCLRRLPRGIAALCLSDAPLGPLHTELNARGDAALLTEDDMRLDERDVRALCAAYGAPLDEWMYAEIAETTLGWSFAVHAALQALHAGRDLGAAEATPAEFIDARIWPLWSPAEQDFLLRTAFLEVLSPPLCDHLTGGGSEALLRGLSARNAFVRPAPQGGWRLSEVLRRHLMDRARKTLAPEALHDLYREAAVWFFRQGEYHLATDCYVLSRDHAGLSHTIAVMSDREFENSVENLYLYARDHIARLPEGYIDDKPDLLAHRAWYSYLRGDAAAFADALDGMTRLSAAMGDAPALLRDVLAFIPALDFRVDTLTLARAMAFPAEGGRERPPRINTITQNLPYAHRSMRDFSDLAGLGDGELAPFRSTFDRMIGGEFAAFELCLRAGLHYDRSELAAAYRLALSAYESLSARHSLEYHFCTLMILNRILLAMHREDNARDIFEEAGRLVATRKGAHFRANYEACRVVSLEADESLARDWLANRAAADDDELLFFRLAQHFATIRSLLITGQPQRATLLCRRLRRMVADYRRPLDAIEASILISIAHWEVGDPRMAADALRGAFLTARRYRYTQLFVEYGRRIKPIFLYMERIDALGGVSPILLAEIMGIALQDAQDLQDFALL